MIKSYLINLDKDSERLDFFATNFKKLGLEFERVSATDGRTFSEEDFQTFMRARPRNNKSWMRGQMGCFLSHYRTWEKIVQGNDRFYAVFEDDVHISDDLKQLLGDDNWIPDNVDIIRLETSTNRMRLTSQPLLTYAQRKMYGIKSTSWCTGGYLISKRTAQQLLDLPVKYHQPSDVMLYNFEDSIIAKKLNMLQCCPALCTQDKHLATGSLEFSSNVELYQPKQNSLITTLQQKKASAIFNGLQKSLRGYKRITFQ